MSPAPTKSKSSNTPEKMECDEAIPSPGAESDIVKEKIKIEPAFAQNDTPKVLKADWGNYMNKIKGGTTSPDIKVRYPTEETSNINGTLSNCPKRSKADACGEGNENESGSPWCTLRASDSRWFLFEFKEKLRLELGRRKRIK